jgi:hypothetical protein
MRPCPHAGPQCQSSCRTAACKQTQHSTTYACDSQQQTKTASSSSSSSSGGISPSNDGNTTQCMLLDHTSRQSLCMQPQYRRLLAAAVYLKLRSAATHLSSSKAASSGRLSAAWDACSSLATAPGEKLQQIPENGTAHGSRLSGSDCGAAVRAIQPQAESRSSSCSRVASPSSC